MHQRVVSLAHHLHNQFGVNKGDRVAILGRNHIDFVVAFWAVNVLGAVPALVNAFLEGEAMYACIRDVGCKVVIADVERVQRLEKSGCLRQLFEPFKGAMDDFGSTPGAHDGLAGVVVQPRAIGGVVPKDQRPWTLGRWGAKVFDADELQAKLGSPTAIPAAQVSPEDLGAILFTSGTTGRPKGVCSTQRQFISSVLNSSYTSARAFVRRGVAPPVPDPFEDQPAILLMVPLFHSTGIQSTLLPYTLRGSRVVLLPRYSVDAAGAAIERYKAKLAIGIGFMTRELINSKYDLSSIQALSFGGSSAAKEIPAEFKRRFPSGLVGQGYGATESNGSAVGIAGDDFLARPTSTGLPPPTTDVVIMDEDTLTEVPRGSVGEVWLRGPGIALGYWGRPKANAETFVADGWYRTGDVGRMDAEGFVYIVDRSKHIIIRGGENISGVEVENAVYEESRIIDCAAVPVPCERFGERVAVVCVPHSNCDQLPTEQDIIAKAAKVLPKHAVPEFVWIRTEPLERNANGKVDKLVIKETVRKRFAGTAPTPAAKM